MNRVHKVTSVANPGPRGGGTRARRYLLLDWKRFMRSQPPDRSKELFPANKPSSKFQFPSGNDGRRGRWRLVGIGLKSYAHCFKSRANRARSILIEHQRNFLPLLPKLGIEITDGFHFFTFLSRRALFCSIWV